MRRTIRTCFAASVVSTIALAAPGCGGGSKPATQPELEGMPGNPPPPELPADFVPIDWLISQAGDGHCLAFNQGDKTDERHIYCPEGVDLDVGASVRQTGPEQCTVVLDDCVDDCAPAPTPCPDPAGSWDEDDDPH